MTEKYYCRVCGAYCGQCGGVSEADRVYGWDSREERDTPPKKPPRPLSLFIQDGWIPWKPWWFMDYHHVIDTVDGPVSITTDGKKHHPKKLTTIQAKAVADFRAR